MALFKMHKNLSCMEVMNKILSMNVTKDEVDVPHNLVKVLIDNSEHVANQVYCSHIGHTTLIIDVEDGEIFKFNNTYYEYEVVGGNILAKDYALNEWIVVYCGSTETFDFRDIMVTNGYTTAGSGDYPCLSLADATIGEKKIRIHTIVYAVVNGYEVLRTLGGVRTHELHHIKGLRGGNGICNLIMLETSEHRRLHKRSQG